MCRYSRGRGLRICCPRSSFFTHYLSSEREDPYNKDEPIAFPSSEYKPTNSHRPYHQQTTDPYGGRPFTDDSNYRPFKPATSSHNRPVYNERPSYESGSDYSSLNHRPHYSEQPTYGSEPSIPSYMRPDLNERPSYNNQPSYNERPAYIPDSNPSYSRPDYNERPTHMSNSKPSYSRPDFNERPETLRPPYNNRPSYNNERPSLVSGSSDTSFGNTNYNERPGNVNPSFTGGNQGRPNSFRPQPDVHGSSEGSAWDFPTTKRTTSRPTWAVEDDDEETASSNRKRISEQSKLLFTD